MKRNQRTELIVLQSEKNGENHKLVSMFTEKFGLVRAIAFGASGSKSPMRAATSPFCLSDGELYHDPVKDLWRITHLNGKNLYDGIRGNLKKFYIVSFLAEVVLKTYGGGDERVYKLFTKTLLLVDKAINDCDVDRLLILYLWRYLWMNGVLPDLKGCSICGKEILLQDPIYYKGDGLFCCGRCRSRSFLELNHGAKEYLYKTSSMTYEEALPVFLDAEALSNIKKCFILIVQALVEYPLKTLESGRSFIF